MGQIRKAIRKPARSPTVRAWHTLNSPAVRSLLGHRRGPGDLSQALTAFTRALRCHRRLARLAPRFFDSTVVDREARERLERHRWMESWRPILDKVYGPAPPSEPRADMEPDHAPLPGPRTRRAVERELAGWELWMAVGRLAMARHQQHQPHALLSFSQLPRLLQIAFDFGRLACGLAAYQPDPPVIPNVPTVDEMLARARSHP